MGEQGGIRAAFPTLKGDDTPFSSPHRGKSPLPVSTAVIAGLWIHFPMPFGNSWCPLRRGGYVIATMVYAAAITNCTNASQVSLYRNVRADCGSRSDRDYFFPRGVFSNRSVEDQYSTILRPLNEPSLTCGHQVENAYRLVWIHVFEANPTIIRIQQSDSHATLVAYQLNGNDPFQVVKHIEKQLSTSDWQSVSGLVRESEFWSPLPQPVLRSSLLDPDTIFIEGRNGGDYNVVFPPLSTRDRTFARLTREFFVRAALPVPADLADR